MPRRESLGRRPAIRPSEARGPAAGRWLLAACLLALAQVVAACSGPSPTPAPVDEVPLRLAASAEAIPDSVLARFSRQGGRAVDRIDVADIEAAIRAGRSIDLALLPTEALPGLIEDGLLRPLERAELSGLGNLPISFRDLAHDPGNRHSLPLRYGIVGLVASLDGAGRIPDSWDEALDPDRPERLILRPRPHQVFGAALLAEGLEDRRTEPQALTVAVARWTDLAERRPLRLLETEDSLAEAFEEPGVMIGTAADLDAARRAGADAIFVVPREGAMLWIEHLVIPGSSQQATEAIRLIDHLLQPEMASLMAAEGKAALANAAVGQRLAPSLLADRRIWPAAGVLRQARLMLPVEPADRVLLANGWEDLRPALERAAP